MSQFSVRIVYHSRALIWISLSLALLSLLTYTLAYVARTHAYVYLHDLCIYSPSFSHDTRDRLCNVLANMHSYSLQRRILRTRRLSPIANYIRSLLHVGELRVSGGSARPDRTSGGRRGEAGRVQGRVHPPVCLNHEAATLSLGNMRFECRYNKALWLRGLRFGDDDSSSPYLSLSLLSLPSLYIYLYIYIFPNYLLTIYIKILFLSFLLKANTFYSLYNWIKRCGALSRSFSLIHFYSSYTHLIFLSLFLSSATPDSRRQARPGQGPGTQAISLRSFSLLFSAF